MSKQILMAHNGHTPYRIIMAHPGHETIKYACDELHHFFYQVTGASLPINNEKTAKTGPEIIVGISKRFGLNSFSLPGDLGEEGYVQKTVGDSLILAGATPRATLYAVYAFLEEQLGCRWFSSHVSRIPRQLTLPLPTLDTKAIPAFESREAYWRDAFDGTYAVRNRMNGNKADISIRQGGRMKFYNFHHSFEDLVPPSVYYDEHPEYFSLVEGQRLRERSQLCLTNPNVKRIATQQVMKWIEDHPDCRVFSVAQNDWYNYCQCPECAAIDQREESPAGTMLSFVNDIANAVFQKHPDVLLHTFAYQYTRKAPKTLRPRDNVIVRLCTIECCFSHPLNGKLKPGQKVAPLKNAHLQCAALGEPVFLQDLRAWSQITHRLYVWDYVTDFAHYLLPFPNFDVLQANIQLFHQMGVKGLLEQGNFSHGGGGHFAELQAYLQAKLMWNPNCDMAYHIKDFVQGFYGTQACDCILEYIACLQKAIGP